MLEQIDVFLRRWLPAFEADQRCLPHRGDRLHRRPASLGLVRRAARRGVSRKRRHLHPPSRARCVVSAIALPDLELPLFPLRTVLFPDGLLELKIFEARYLDLMSRCMRETRPFGVVCLKSGSEARGSGEPVSLYDVGTLAELIDVDSAQAGILIVRCRGTRRFALGATRQQADGLWVGAAERRSADDPDDRTRARRMPASRRASAMPSPASPPRAAGLSSSRTASTSASWVANRWCELLPLPLEAKQRLMTLADPLARLDIIDSLMRGKSGSH